MKLIFIILTIIGCSQAPQRASLKEPNKFHYLQEFYKLRDKLKNETKSCKHYTKNSIKPRIDSSEKSFQSSRSAAADYSPQLFDWKLKNQIKELYLSYEYSVEIMQEHLEISNNIQDCMNEFSNMKFLKKAINSYHDSPKSNKKIFKKYFSYIQKTPLSPLNVLITADILYQMHEKNILKIDHLAEFESKRKKLEKLFSHTGKESLKAFRNQNYKKMYTLGKNLKKKKDEFKNYLTNIVDIQ